MSSSVILYKEGDQMGIKTDCHSEEEFLIRFTEVLSRLIEKKEFDGHWQFQLDRWLSQVVDLCCAYRGYKSEQVQRIQVLAVGDTSGKVVAKIIPPEINAPTGIVDFARSVTNGELKQLGEEHV